MMRLAKLTAQGFKSFADKTVITFDKPITGIVGPNGCGKSNTVDAVKWVLGELSAKSLRGGAMMDMIFNGSSTRKPAGMASVSLTFDNPYIEESSEFKVPSSELGNNQPANNELADDSAITSDDAVADVATQNSELGTRNLSARRALPIDADQVTVTRQLYRDGSSEYLINRQRARLRDIRELFMDTGIGTDAYSIIEQGRVALLLDSNAKERREIFEEAAGISRFKARKKEAERKLERTEQHLGLTRTRFDDLQKRLRSVKIQAGRARSHQELSTRLRELQLNYALAEYHKLQGRFRDVTEQLEQAEADHAVAARHLAEHEQQLADNQIEKQSVEQQLKKLEQDRLQARSRQEQAEQRKQFAKNSLADLEKQIERDGKRTQELTARSAQLEDELAQQNDEVRRLAASHAGTQRQLEEAQNKHRQAQHELNEKRSALEDEKAGIVTLMRRTSQLHNEIHSISAFEKNLHGTREKLDLRSTRVAQDLERLLTSRDETQARLAEVRTLIEQQTAKIDELKSQASELDAEQRALTERLGSAKEQRSGLSSRRSVLQEMQDKQEGIADAVKAVLARKASSELRVPSSELSKPGSSASSQLETRNSKPETSSFHFVRGLLAEMFETDVEHALLVEAALGEHQQSLVVSSLSDLCENGGSEAIAALAGRVTFISLDQCLISGVGCRVSGVRSDTSELNLSRSAESDPTPDTRYPIPESLIDHVRFSPEIAPIAWHLLSRTYIVDDLAAAKHHREIMPDGCRFVTQRGELLEADGRIMAGPMGAKSASGIISRRAELTRLRTQLAELDERISTDQQTLSQLSDRAKHIDRVSQELRQKLYEANTMRVECSSRLDNLAGQIASLEREQPVLSAEIEQIHRQLHDAQQKKTVHESEAAKLEEDSAARQAAVDLLQNDIKELSGEAEAAREAVTTVRVEQSKLAEQLSASQRQVRQMEIARADIDRQHKLIDEQLRQHHRRTEEHQRVAEEARNVSLQAAAELDQLEGALEGVREKLVIIEETLNELRGAMQRHRKAAESSDALVHQLHVEKRELEVKCEAVCQRAAEQLNLDVVARYNEIEAARDEGAEIEGVDDATPQAADETPDTRHPTPVTAIDWEAVEQEIHDLKTKLDRLGNVNLDAIAEQDEIEKQVTDLEVQVKDIEDGKNKLEQLIKQINEESRTRFEATFNQIKENFAGQNGLFRKLFGGGRADVFFQPDEEGNMDVLESGIEVVAKPPGKEPQSITLLSGGEKTMTAVALLLSIFQTRPSPFAILDEVDAALDEANVHRFASILHSFLDKSHFIVITHNKGTMQTCDVLYGITMQERGVSKRVSVQFDQIGAGGQISQAAIEAQNARDKATTGEEDDDVPMPSGTFAGLELPAGSQPRAIEESETSEPPTIEDPAPASDGAADSDKAPLRNRLASMVQERQAIEARSN